MQRYQDSRERQEKEYLEAGKEQSTAQRTEQLVGPDPVEDDLHGPRRTINGTIRDVQCSERGTMHLRVENAKKPVLLRARNYYKVQFSALNFTPTAELNPCKDIEGMKARVEFFEALNESAQGQIVAIELTK